MVEPDAQQAFGGADFKGDVSGGSYSLKARTVGEALALRLVEAQRAVHAKHAGAMPLVMGAMRGLVALSSSAKLQASLALSLGVPSFGQLCASSPGFRFTLLLHIKLGKICPWSP